MSIAERAVADLLPALQPSIAPSNPLGSLAPLPRDLLLYLLSFLDFKNLMTVSLLSKSYKKLAEDETIALGKVKRAYRVFNGKFDIKELSAPDQDHTLLYENSRTLCRLTKNGRITEVDLPHPADAKKRFSYNISSKLFVYSANYKWISYQINYDTMSIVSSELPSLSSVTQLPDDDIRSFSQQDNALYLEYLERSNLPSKDLHIFAYAIDEEKGPASLYLGQAQHHLVCCWQDVDDGTLAYNFTSIRRIEKENNRDIIQWSRTESIKCVFRHKIRGNWLVLQSGSVRDKQYHFLDVASGQKIYTYDPKDGNYPQYKYIYDEIFFLKENICVIPRRTHKTDIAGAIVLQLELKKSIPLPYKTMESLNSSRLKEVKKINSNFTTENGFFEIEGTDRDHRRIQIRFSGNPLATLLTALSPRAPFYLRASVALRIAYRVFQLIFAVIVTLALVLGGIALISAVAFTAFKGIRNMILKKFQK